MKEALTRNILTRHYHSNTVHLAVTGTYSARMIGYATVVSGIQGGMHS